MTDYTLTSFFIDNRKFVNLNKKKIYLLFLIYLTKRWSAA